MRPISLSGITGSKRAEVATSTGLGLPVLLIVGEAGTAPLASAQSLKTLGKSFSIRELNETLGDLPSVRFRRRLPAPHLASCSG